MYAKFCEKKVLAKISELTVPYSDIGKHIILSDEGLCICALKALMRRRAKAQLPFSFVFTYTIMPYPSFNMRAQVSIELCFKSLVSSLSLQFL